MLNHNGGGVAAATPRAGVLADAVRMASSLLLHLGQHSTSLAHHFIRLQLKEPSTKRPSVPHVGSTPAVAHVLHELCTAPTSDAQVRGGFVCFFLASRFPHCSTFYQISTNQVRSI